ncbi:hypothetical protein ABES25_04720 [Bacillus gobiensis]|uniref:hypothetical protein n=1 Tax=Bacillus gobiensis TaxID=1441095 RepID=UPI003D203561
MGEIKFLVTDEEAGRIGEAVGILSYAIEQINTGNMDFTAEQAVKIDQASEALAPYDSQQLKMFFDRVMGGDK